MPRTKFVRGIILSVLLLVVSNVFAADTLVTIKEYSLGYKTDKRLKVFLKKCIPGDQYFVSVCTSESDCSPSNCKAGLVYSEMPFEDFRSRIKDLMTRHLLLSNNPDHNVILVEDLFTGQRNFLTDMEEHVYKDIKEKLSEKKPTTKPPAKKPKGNEKKNKRSSVAEVSEEGGDAENEESEGEDAEEDSEEDGDEEKISIANITFLNAANFSFEGKLSASYLGLLNIFAPSIKETRWGFNTGIQKINYSNPDTNSVQYFQDNVLIDPLDTIRNGTPYLRQFNKYAVTSSNTVWSFYVQPMFRLTNVDEDDLKLGIFVHAHCELLIYKWKVNVTIENMSQDTAIMSGTRGTLFNSFLPEEVNINQTFLNGYFGGGFTLYLNPFGTENSRFFFQPTIGVTTNTPGPASVDIESNSASTIISSIRPSRTRSFAVSDSWNGFYLVKAKFVQALSTKAQIIVGTEIRGLFPRHAPQYAAFAGINLDLNELSKLLSN